MSMKTIWQLEDESHAVTAPLSLIISGFAPATDVRKTLTPQLQAIPEESLLMLVDLGRGKNRLGGSILAQVYGELGDEPADLDNAELLKQFFNAIQQLNRESLLLAYHDRSDGGLLVTLLEMMFAGHLGMDVDIQALGDDELASLCAEELGAVIQLRASDRGQVEAILSQHGLGNFSHVLGPVIEDDYLIIRRGDELVLQESRVPLQRAWSETTYQMQSLRDNPESAQQEFDSLLDEEDPGMQPWLSFDINEDIAAPYINTGIRPSVAILREQGVNGQLEMAAAFHRAGFDAVDVHMSDLLAGRTTLSDFRGLVACGGFSYGDVLGAGEGWAKTILFNEAVRDGFADFFARNDTFSLGVCNGCQMMANLKQLIPGAGAWPHFVRNLSEQFEARYSLVEVMESPSILLQDMAGSRMGIAVAHGEGQTEFRHGSADQARAALRFVDNYGNPTETYPFNPNGSQEGLTGFTSDDGRVTIMMPHPERVFRTLQNSWHPQDWDEDSPWMRMFRNARAWVN